MDLPFAEQVEGVVVEPLLRLALAQVGGDQLLVGVVAVLALAPAVVVDLDRVEGFVVAVVALDKRACGCAGLLLGQQAEAVVVLLYVEPGRNAVLGVAKKIKLRILSFLVLKIKI
ncbi:hypothetical protein RZO07_18440 [Pseudomonas protegens]|uniref:hypothetical protein n=1 Tax=Pseudomonas protegens TaxID=380021 RepID=UPI0029373F2C|nr:hypothetical protein [Pseudomonas protegens]WOE77309.1 hypothetical protein RZO07_18440 [Pseudomonas protegens]